MKKLMITLLALSALVFTTGCEPTDPDRRYDKCVESGGSWIEDAWGQSCVMPGHTEEPANG